MERPSLPPGTWQFEGLITKVTTTVKGTLAITLELGWEYRTDVMEALDEVPIVAKILMTPRSGE